MHFFGGDVDGDSTRETRAYLAFKEECIAIEAAYSVEEPIGSLANTITQFHKLKGSAGFFGHDDISQVAGKLEEILKSGDMEQFRVCLRDLLDLLSNLRRSY